MKMLGEPEFKENILYYSFLNELFLILIRNGFSCSHAKLILDETRKRGLECSGQFEVISNSVEAPEPESLERIAKTLFTPRPHWGRLVAFLAYLAYLQKNSTEKLFWNDHLKKLKQIVKCHIVPWTLGPRDPKPKQRPFDKLPSAFYFLTAAASCLTLLLLYFRTTQTK
ncbi:A9 [Alcelaphine gammaherpesvirus 1]|uniref:Putative apoptosis regulator A9 n=1 Tax=Alcelaphine herpesvirus 1 (strain C500) TaxID=654901 RepID=VGA9_ALHV1|nr:A9 [Alcelaphine gammaherpesvirus 1]O36423.1 RecName: Full=Putative apoptosis regulator A9 [Alcelaphine herpesvirus 1 strain C500]AAC58120.1 A9 [Alcelaphine gammaherpesvirus 1]APB09496.1 apoptosis regulator A9 [Alcelaphine gammaherpesvirus 1]APB09568.1 apoptosis regulator A9 [Alcelaphine gammaherpesvirus 1]ATI21959.1 ORFA9 [Alcelaphine gammaherpesvirus 1]QDY92307.1 apoptosis regulator A9 [Alcelaphine gammaherpesvirus 1]